jgi:hypothetical protein
VSFTRRFGLQPAPEIDPASLIRDDAPEAVRVGFLAVFEELLGPKPLRAVVCRTLGRFPDENNWSDYPNVWGEVVDLIRNAPWNRFFDIVEAAVQTLENPERRRAIERLNELFVEQHVAWHLVRLGELELRTGDVNDDVVAHAISGLEQAGRHAGARELQRAMQALSVRPDPDTRDAVRGAVGALEALARDITGDREDTLGEILGRRGEELLSPPLPRAFSMIWGFASDRARHVDEQRAPTVEEAIFIVGIAAAAAALLSRR